MSLRVWLPLNGDLKNYGASNTNLSSGNATYDSSGKIGGCYSFNGSSNFLKYDYSITEFSVNTKYSITAWVYLANTPNESPIIGTDSYHWTLYFKNESTIGFTCWDASGSHTNNLTGTVYSGEASLKNAWHHLALTWDGNKIKFYLDGIKSSSELTLNASGSTLTRSYGICVGGKIYAWSVKYFGGKINDVRIYDHCLSPDEVKEISKALVLYYPLNNTSIKTPNLIERMEAGSRTTLINNYAFDATFTSSDTYAWFDTYPALTLGKTYTLSFDIENLASGSAWTWCLWNNANYPVAITKNGHYSYTFIPDESKLPSGYSLSRFLFDDAGKTNPTGTVRFKNFKIELGEKDTPFCTINETPEVYDNSGYNRHGTVTSSTCPIITTDSRKNDYCCQFDGTDDYIVAPVKQSEVLADKKFTVSAWVYLTNFKEARGIMGPHSASPASGICFCQCNGSKSKMLFSAYGGSSSAIYDPDGYFLNTWKYYAMTDDGSTTIVYRDGVEIARSNSSGIIFDDSTNITVGRAYNGSNRYWQGKISDVKLYATVLSASDIEKEYHRYAAIYNNHSFAANEFIEDSKASVGINGVLKGNLIEGDYSKVSIIPSSGNIQATEFIEGI